jgi:hypothetical protein
MRGIQKDKLDLSLFSYGKQSLEASRFYGWLFYFTSANIDEFFNSPRFL